LINSRGQVRWKTEVLLGVIVTAALVWIMHSALIQGETILAHDNLYWGYPLFQFYADAVLQGRFPLWNPFTHGGEPFYPLLVMTRLLDPTTFVVIKGGSLITNDLVTLFNWDRFIKGLVIAVGTCLLLRRWAEHWLPRLAIIPVVVLSSYHLANFRQTAVPDQFLTAPFVILLFFRVLCDGDRRWWVWVALGVLLGMNMQGYFFTGIWTFLFLLIVGIAMFRKDLLENLVAMPGLARRVGVLVLIVGLMSLPDVILMQDKKEFVFPARMLDEPYKGKRPEGGPQQYEPGPYAIAEDSVVMPYGLVAHTGTFSNVVDFIQIVEPYGSRFVNPDNMGWGNNGSEAFIYLGMLTYVGAVFGLVYGRHPLKRVWIAAGCGIGLLLLGPVGGVHAVLFHVYPPLWFVRHTHAMISFFDLAVLFFFVLGCNALTYLIVNTSASERMERLCWLHGEGSFWELAKSHWQSMVWLMAGIFVGGLLLRNLRDWGPQGILQFVILAVVLSAILAYRVRVGRSYLAVLIIGTHLTLLFTMTHARVWWSILVALTVLVPFLLIHRCFRYGHPSPEKVCAALVIVLTMDLLSYDLHVRGLWDQQRPDTILGFKAAPEAPHFPDTRTVFPPKAGPAWPYDQMIRYLDSVHRTPAALSPPFGGWGSRVGHEDVSPLDSMKEGIEGKRWNSFLMSKHYYKLLHSGVSGEALLDVFGVTQPLIQFKQHVVVMDDDSLRGSLQTMDQTKLSAFLRQTVIVSEDSHGAFAETNAPKSASNMTIPAGLTGAMQTSEGRFQWKVESYDYNELIASVSLPNDGFLYWADGYNPHWRAWVDGAGVRVLRANLNFKAIKVPSGAHKVRFAFEPEWYSASVTGFLLMNGLLFVLVPILAIWEKRTIAEP